MGKDLGTHAVVTQLAECQPSKLEVAGSTPVSRSTYQHKDTPETFWDRMAYIHGEDVRPSSVAQQARAIPS